MTMYKKIMLAAVLAAPGAVIAASQAQAQVAGIAVADPEAAILQAKALEAANVQISTTYKTQLDQARTRQQSLQTELTTLGGPLDTNKDGTLSEAELATAQTAKNPALTKIQAAQTSAQTEIARLNEPAARAQAYVIEQIALKYDAATTAVVTAKKISLLLNANSAQFAQPTVDVTAAITAEIDRALPTATITVPANWRPSRQIETLQQQFQQAIYLQAVQRARAAAPAGTAPAGTTPAAPARPQPQGR